MNNNHHILRLPLVMQKVGLSRSSIYDLIKKEAFPKPIKLGLRSVGWLVKDIDDWISGRTSESRGHAREIYDNSLR